MPLKLLHQRVANPACEFVCYTVHVRTQGRSSGGDLLTSGKMACCISSVSISARADAASNGQWRQRCAVLRTSYTTQACAHHRSYSTHQPIMATIATGAVIAMLSVCPAAVADVPVRILVPMQTTFSFMARVCEVIRHLPVNTVCLQAATMSDLKNASSTPVAKPVNKTKIWVLLCGGAAGLFALTILSERNTGIFPAISRANEALEAQRAKNKSDTQDTYSASSGPQEMDQALGGPIDTTAASAREQDSSEDAVLAGLQAARERAAKKPSKDDLQSQESASNSKP